MSSFWQASVIVTETNEHRDLLIESPHSKTRTKEILANVHPEFTKITLTKIPKPDWCIQMYD